MRIPPEWNDELKLCLCNGENREEYVSIFLSTFLSIFLRNGDRLPPPVVVLREWIYKYLHNKCPYLLQ
ncbi:MAG: hypothetical protein IJT36_07590 [Alphaproteobacteria bacterium]|nr:hypothetical protein [Alphaproteobacteria bacterium]